MSDHASLDALTRTLADQEDRLATCIHCGFCLPACPTYTRLGDEADSPRGRLYLMRAVVEGRLPAESEAFHRHLDRCLGCRACETVCPSGVPYGHLLERAREVTRAAHPPPTAVRILLAVMARPRWTRVATALARLVRGSGLAHALARLLPRRLALPMAMLAASAPVRLSDLSSENGALVDVGEHPETPGRPPHEGRRVALLRGCVQEGLFGHVNRATERVLRANDYELIETRGQGCCGALHAHAGDRPTARALARRNVQAFQASAPDVIGVNAAGCGAAMREYGDLLEGDPLEDSARDLAARVRDVSELLAAAGPRGGDPIPADVTWDPPCHLLHAQGVREAPHQVLAAIPGLRCHEADRASECCGGAGVYGMTHPDLGGRIGADKIRAVGATGPDAVVTSNPGCQMQIGAGLLLEGDRVPVIHLVELLDESYRRAALADGTRDDEKT